MSKHQLAIDNIQVPEGYKKTDVGVIPEDWEVTCLDKIAKLSSGTTPSRTQEERYYRDGEYFWVKTTDLNNSKITATEEKVTKIALEETCLQIYQPGTVLVAMYGGFNQIGRTGLIRIAASVNQAIVAIQAKSNKLNPEYLLAMFNFRVEHWKSVASSSIKDPNITSKDVKDFVLPLPKLEEQRAIAQTLSDVDGLIAALDQAIAKKRNIKTATMQELLTGKKRLPGFHGEWEMKLLGEMGVTYGGLNGKTKADFGTGSSQYIPFLNIINNVVVDPYDLKRVKVSICENQNEVKMGDLFLKARQRLPKRLECVPCY
ncbi:MAG: restriction endonuclease subunit S [Hormoscilla sp. GUM202]|nr:restriction endonuclease subunit S [Hormoscilla sp. GUM202]